MTVLDDTSVALTWQPVSTSAAESGRHGDDDVSYEVSYWSVSSTAVHQLVSGLTTVNVTLRTLRPATRYCFTVRCTQS